MAGLGGLAKGDSDTRNRITAGVGICLRSQRRSSVEKSCDVDTHECRRNQPEMGERREPTSDVRIRLEDGVEAALTTELGELRSGIGHRDEPVTVPPGCGPEIAEERQRLERGPGLRGDDERGSLRIDLRLDREHCARMGRVEDEQLREAL